MPKVRSRTLNICSRCEISDLPPSLPKRVVRKLAPVLLLHGRFAIPQNLL